MYTGIWVTSTRNEVVRANRVKVAPQDEVDLPSRVQSHYPADQWEQANAEPVEKTHYRVKGLPVGEKMLFRVVAVNRAGRSPPATLTQAVSIREIMEQPKIRLPRYLRTKLIKRVGEKINLVIPFQGKPRPVVTWLRDDVPLEDTAMGIRTTEVDTMLFIRSAERAHSGKYTLSVQIENVCAKADVHIQVV
ncbi:hypothetical protein CRUP_009266, partial [Coryphaenoides rupestris]